MKQTAYFFIFILLSFIVCLSEAQNTQLQAQQALDKHISQKRSAGISAGFATAEKISWIGYAGHADVEEEVPLDASTLLRSASIAKPMTAVAILQLHEQGKLDLDKAILEYLPDFPILEGQEITVRQLLQHSSGIGNYKSAKESENKRDYPGLKEAMEIFAKRKLLFSPGSDFSYTSYGYVVLGWVIEQVSGLSYGDYMRKHIWEPANMRQTGIEKYHDPEPMQSGLYTQKNRGKKAEVSSKNRIKKLERTNLSNRTPGGGFYTTSEDLLRFGQALLTHRLISKASTELMWTNSGLKKRGNPYGMGWYLYGENPAYGQVYGHSGTQAGASNQFMILPEEGLVVVAMSNTSHVWEQVFGLTVKLFELGANDKRDRP